MLSLRIKLCLGPKARETFFSCNNELGDTDGSGARYGKCLCSCIQSLFMSRLCYVCSSPSTYVYHSSAG